jgi:hypothetical protein
MGNGKSNRRGDIVHRIYRVQTRRAEDMGLTVAHPDSEHDFPDPPTRDRLPTARLRTQIVLTPS